MATFPEIALRPGDCRLLLGDRRRGLWPDFAVKMKPLGDGFIKLIKMAIAPLVFGVVVHGIVGAGDLRKVGRVGVKAIVYFEVRHDDRPRPRRRRRLRRRPGRTG